MGMLASYPGSEHLALGAAGHNRYGEFVISNKDGQAVVIPNEWKVPLAAHLLADVDNLFAPEVTKRISDLRTRLEKKKGKKSQVEVEDIAFLKSLQHSLECLMQEYLEGDPKTSSRYEYAPRYPRALAYTPSSARMSEETKRVIADLILPDEEQDDTPLPWAKNDE
jgi:hypothetical protein